MNGRVAASSPDRPVYPEYRERFGEDPARFLYADLDPRPRIRAIRSPALLRAYLDVETDRDEPRRAVVGCLNQQLTAADARIAADGGREDE